jgi:hypothetical protein
VKYHRKNTFSGENIPTLTCIALNFLSSLSAISKVENKSLISVLVTAMSGFSVKLSVYRVSL